MANGRLRSAVATTVAGLLLAASAAGAPAASAAAFAPVSGAGSTGSSDAVNQWASALFPFGLTMSYQATGSTSGLRFFASDVVDFAVTETPYGIDVPVPAREHAYVPLHGTALSVAYNVSVNGARLTGLRLSPGLVARIFTGDVARWDDPAVAAENPGVSLPPTPVTPVVRSGVEGSTLQFTSWLADAAPARWDAWCVRAARTAPCGGQSSFPVVAGAGFLTQNGSVGVAARVSTVDGAVTYVEHGTAVATRLSEAKLLNDAGWYAAPGPGPASVALAADVTVVDPLSAVTAPASLRAWHATDPRAYPLAYPVFLVVPTVAVGSFTTDKGRAPTDAFRYAVCTGQVVLPDLGIPLLPPRSVAAALQRLGTVPGADANSPVTFRNCASPAVGIGNSSPFVDAVPQPVDCDRAGSTPCGVAPPTPTPTPTPTPVPTPSPTRTGRNDDDHGHDGHGHDGHGHDRREDDAERHRHGRGER